MKRLSALLNKSRWFNLIRLLGLIYTNIKLLYISFSIIIYSPLFIEMFGSIYSKDHYIFRYVTAILLIQFFISIYRRPLFYLSLPAYCQVAIMFAIPVAISLCVNDLTIYCMDSDSELVEQLKNGTIIRKPLPIVDGVKTLEPKIYHVTGGQIEIGVTTPTRVNTIIGIHVNGSPPTWNGIFLTNPEYYNFYNKEFNTNFAKVLYEIKSAKIHMIGNQTINWIGAKNNPELSGYYLKYLNTFISTTGPRKYTEGIISNALINNLSGT